MKILTSFFILLSMFSWAEAQQIQDSSGYDPAILMDDFRNEGIYTTIDQFLTNSPERIVPLKLDLRVLSYLDPRTNRFRPYQKTHWGACIDNQVYFQHMGKYLFVQPIGRFSFFTNHRYYIDEQPRYQNLPKYRIADNTKEFIIDFKTDKRYRLNSTNVKSILMAENPMLYQEFIKMHNNKYLLKEFIIKLNKTE